MPAICQECGKEMKASNGCTITHFSRRRGKSVARIKCYNDGGRPCHDCNVSGGQYHHPGCDMERCPLCGGQSISCECNW